MSSLISSWISTAMILTMYYRINRSANQEKDNVDVISSFMYFLSRFVEIGPRCLLFALTIFYFKPWCFIFIPFHVAYVTTMYALNNPKFEGICPQPEGTPVQDRKRKEGSKMSSFSICSSDDGSCSSVLSKLFIFLMGLIGLFSFMNLKEGSTFKTAMLYYMVYYIENIVMVVFIIVTSSSTGGTSWDYCLFAVPVGLLCHVLLIFLFYSFCHPLNSSYIPMELTFCFNTE